MSSPLTVQPQPLPTSSRACLLPPPPLNSGALDSCTFPGAPPHRGPVLLFPGLEAPSPRCKQVSSLPGSQRFPAPAPGMQMLLEWESKSRSQPWEASAHTRSQHSRYTPRNLPVRLPRPSPCQRSTSDLTLFPQAEAMEHTCLTSNLQAPAPVPTPSSPPALSRGQPCAQILDTELPPPPCPRMSSCRHPLFRIVNQPLLPTGSPPIAHRHSV